MTSNVENSANGPAQTRVGPAAELQMLLARRKNQWASEVIEGKLWLGSGTHASKLQELQSRSITRVLNVADDVPNYHEGENQIRYKRLDVVDFGQDAGISRVFQEAFAFLEEAESEQRATLVHCAAGANRSATIVLAWLMKSKKMTLAESWAYLKSKRPGIVPLKDNRLELLKFERALFDASSFKSDQEFLDLK